ncbi:retinol-binding protein 4 [Platysternon megacephalum]|uniref:Retinol-binding protein 4 n=1 Tax=Platysternon megacephalum TaxID=55544 RepID=A0A4D9EGS5_9SAUR|nr:retinol-binding protein 4 [Platysternon megacephalum]
MAPKAATNRSELHIYNIVHSLTHSAKEWGDRRYLPHRKWGLFGWLLIGVIAVLVFLTKCLKHCCSPLSYLQEGYWSQYRSSEAKLFARTAEVHSKILAANNVKQFFGFVALNKEEKELVEEFPVEGVQPSPQWNAITGVYIYRENKGFPLYSRLHKWAKGVEGNGPGPDGQEMVFLAT